MSYRRHTELLKHLEHWFIGDYESEDFYKLFNLEECDYMEFPFKEMNNIFYLEQMTQWAAPLEGSKGKVHDYVITLVSFKPKEHTDDKDKRVIARIELAHEKVREMFKEKINVCMKTFPTMAIFLSKQQKSNRNKKMLPSKEKKEKGSIFDTASRQVYCLSAVNYCRHEQNTVIFWLATTRAKPFEDSINTTWRCSGLATYLLCMLIKQHTCYETNMDQSVLCLQATNEEPNVCRYYKRLGFTHIINFGSDNGLSHMSPEFQRIVKEKLECWDKSSLDFFLLRGGRIIFFARELR